jgi:hypothetical protein
MSQAADLLAYVDRTGGRVWLENDTLNYDLPTDRPELLEQLRQQKERLIGYLEAHTPDTPARVPTASAVLLERVIGAASNGSLPSGAVQLEHGLVPDLERYVLGWAAAYLTGATSEAAKRLWDVWRTWQGAKVTA